MKHKRSMTRFSPIGETNMTIQKFLSQPPGRKTKFGVVVGDKNGKVLVLFTRASSFWNAFQIAKSAYKSAPYPRVGVSHFVVHGNCYCRTYGCGGEWRKKTYLVDWSATR